METVTGRVYFTVRHPTVAQLHQKKINSTDKTAILNGILSHPATIKLTQFFFFFHVKKHKIK